MRKSIVLAGLVALGLAPLLTWAEERPAPNLGLRFAQTRQGVFVVTYVDPSGLAQQIGLQRGDVLKQINSVRLNTEKDVRRGISDIFDGKYRISFARSVDGASDPVDFEPFEGMIRMYKSGTYHHVPQIPRPVPRPLRKP